MKTRKKRKKNFLEENYSLSWKFLKQSKNYILFIFLLFIASIIFGFIFPVFFTDLINKFLLDTLSQISSFDTSQLIAFIIQNNLKSSIIGLFSGLLLGIFPIFVCIINGYLLGFVLSKSVALAGPSVILKLLPHGIFELPALFISLGLGIKLGIEFLRAKQKLKTLAYNLQESLRVFVLIVLPLLVIAGIIEGLLIRLLA